MLLVRTWSYLLVVILKDLRPTKGVGVPYTHFVQVLSPSSLRNTIYDAGYAYFGYNLTGAPSVSGALAIAEPEKGCSAITNPTDIVGKIAIIHRGSCMFITKAESIENAGAIGGIVIDSSSGSSSDTSDPLTMTGSGPTITIPLLFLYQTEGMELLQNVMNYAPTLVEVVLTTTPTNITTSTSTTSTVSTPPITNTTTSTPSSTTTTTTQAPTTTMLTTHPTTTTSTTSPTTTTTILTTNATTTSTISPTTMMTTNPTTTSTASPTTTTSILTTNQTTTSTTSPTTTTTILTTDSTSTSTTSPTTTTTILTTDSTSTSTAAPTTTTPTILTLQPFVSTTSTYITTGNAITVGPTTPVQTNSIYLVPCQCSTGAFDGKTNEEIIQEITADISINAGNTSSSRRKLISVMDTSPSAQTIGYVGSVVLGIGFSLIFGIDLIRVYQFFCSANKDTSSK